MARSKIKQIRVPEELYLRLQEFREFMGQKKIPESAVATNMNAMVRYTLSVGLEELHRRHKDAPK